MSPFWEQSTSINIRRQTGSQTGDEYFDVNNAEQSRYLGKVLSSKQLLIVLLSCAFMFAGLTVRAYNLQVLQGEHYASLSENNRIRSRVVLAPRGVIYDRFGRELTQNEPQMEIAFIPYDMPRDVSERQQLFSVVSPVLMVEPAVLETIWQEIPEWRKNTIDPYLLDLPLGLEEGIKLQLMTESLSGLTVVTAARREYVESSAVQSLSHLLGYVGRVTDKELTDNDTYVSEDKIGKSGVEYIYEKMLKGQNGRHDIEVDAFGDEQKLYSETDAVPGRNIWLTLDLDLQTQMEIALRSALSKVGATKGVVVAMDPRSGEILGMVSWPSFDNNLFSGSDVGVSYADLLADENQPLYNRAVQGLYPSGSTIKPVVAAAALEEGIITPETTFMSTGGINVGQWFFPDWKAGGHGVTDVRKAIAESVNTYFYIIGGGYNDFKGLGIATIKRYAHRFGLGEVTSIDLPGEAAGLVPTPGWKEKVKGERWYIGDTYHAAIGQGDILVTPLQVAQFTSVFANEGKLYRPHLLLESEVVHGGERSRSVPIISGDRIVSTSSVKVVKEGLRQAVTSGSARRLSSLPITSAGKTGTAEVGGDKKPHAWFTGFAPYENPEIVLTVLIEHGDTSNNAVPVAHEILSWWAKNRYEGAVE